MATTDARSGFRLPWSSDRQADNDPVTEVAPAEDAASSEAATTADAGATTTTTSGATDAAPTDAAPSEAAPTDVPSADAAVDPAADPWAGAGASSESATLPDRATPTTPAPQPTRKPNKFLADLTKAMQAAAEEARGHSLQQLQADAKTHIETIHGRSATEAASLRRQADDDVAAVREWSKAEIARVREETEQRITDRKSRLETEIEEHAAVIEREIDAVQRMVSAFEDQMAAFFQRLLAEGDPTRFATMAENLPEPPSFDEISAMIGLPAEPTHADPAVTADATQQAAAEAQSAETAQDKETVEPVAEATAEPTTDQTAIADVAGADVPEAAPLDVAARNDDGTTVAGPSPNDAGESVLEPIATDDSPVAGAEASDSGSRAEVSSPTDGTSDADATSDADGGSDPRSGLDWPGASADPQETSSDSSDVSSDSTDGPAETSFQADRKSVV